MAETIPVKKTETKYIFLRIEDGILFGKWKEGINISLEIAEEVIKSRIEFAENISYPCLIDIRGIRSLTKESRKYLAKEGAELLKAGALLIDSPLTRTIGNIFIYVNKPSVPTKLFTDEAEALKWLEQFKN